VSLTDIEKVDELGPSRSSHRAGALLVATMVVTAVLLLVGVAGREWLAHPDAFGPVGSSARLDGPHAAGAAMTGVMTYGPVDAVDLSAAPRTVDVVSIEPRIVSNSADADVRLVLCPDGAGPATTDAPCAGAVPFTGGQVALGYAPGQQLWVVATSHRAGTLVVDGYDVTYRDGMRSGTQHVDGTLTLVSTA
jgi:hypothetical protein